MCAAYRAPGSQGALEAHDIEEGGVIDRNGVRVSAFAVDHANVKPAFGYRIEYAGHVVVLSGNDPTQF
jgi:ribonuclease Z